MALTRTEVSISMLKFKKLVAAAAVATLTIGLAACSSGGSSNTNSSGSSQPYQVLFMGGTSGFVATLAQAQLAGYQAGAADINAHGGINGRQIEITSVDTAADATKATSLLTQALSSSTPPDLVIPGTTSAETLALLPQLTRSKILGMSESASNSINNPASYPYGFSVSVGQTLPAQALAQYVKSQGYKTVGILAASDETGTAGSTALQTAVQGVGLTANVVSYDAAAVDVSPELEKLRSGNPDVMLYIANGAQIPVILKSRQKIGWTVPTIADLSTGSNDIWQLADGDPAKGTSAMVYPIQAYVDPSAQTEEFKNFNTELATVGVPPYTSSLSLYGLAWDIMHLVQAGAKQANSTAGPDIAKALENLQQPSPQPWVVFTDETFSPTNHFLAPDASQFKVVAVGPTVDGMIKSN
jgi:branched-chain amino acid transport system substrate-binding protein